MKKIYSFNLSLFILISALLLVAQPFNSTAANKVWSYTGATGAWTTGTNWVGGVAPVDGDDVTIGNTATSAINNVPSLSLNSLSIGSSSAVTLTSSGSTLTITTLNITNNHLITGSSVNLLVTNGTISYGRYLSIGSSRTLTISGTLTVAGSITNSGTITVNGLLLFTGPGVTAPNKVVVSSAGEIKFSGSGSVTGLGSSTINGLCTFGGTTGAGSGFVASWGYGSTLQYAGNSSQIANYYELPGSNGPTNVIINNPSGVNFNSSVPPNPVINGTLTLEKGILSMGNGTYPSITFQNGDVPIVVITGAINPGNTATIAFGAPGNTGGAAFTLPDNLFNTTQSLYRFKVERLNPLTLNNQAIIITTFCSLNLGRVHLSQANLTVNASSVTTTGAFGTNTMFVTSSTSGLLRHSFDIAASPVTFTYPIGEVAGSPSYNGFSFSMNANETTAKVVGFKVVDDICNAYKGAAANYTTRYYSTSITGSGSYNYSVSLPYLAAASTDCAGGGEDVVGLESKMSAAYYNGSWKANGTVISPNLVISNGTATTAPLGYDIMGIDGAGTVAVHDPVAQASSITLFPNPAKDRLTVNGLRFKAETTISIYNLLGEQIAVYPTSICHLPASDSQLPSSCSFNISTLSAGIYILQTETDDGLVTKRFVKE